MDINELELKHLEARLLDEILQWPEAGGGLEPRKIAHHLACLTLRVDQLEKKQAARE